MSRIINPDSAGRERTYLSKAIVLALRELTRQTDTGTATRDLVAFITQALEGIAETIEASVGPWEKRGYWVKADRFRMDWAWTERLGRTMRQAILVEDWAEIAATAAKISEKLSTVNVSPRSQVGTPWVGAWEKFLQSNSSSAA